ncbi:NAD(P)H-dependent FMN reductase [Gelidibacter algens]|uniref:NAD(P)H-dependent FMN reductase n=1 Tax=Gelidibacter algens TaxID=49280 RepID=A0A1A7QUF3_9FLAO|nr:NADPH-dependent FMN reductase [Gelidibacter algens]OBX22162.1 FMN reductase [Gelidibacter algens]RAJ19995.1 NAD(P)H-dependent FMN reductase [Gelidibacter algens]
MSAKLTVDKKKILAISGSASKNSASLSISKEIASVGEPHFYMTIWDDLTELPHFITELTDKNVPEKIVEFRNDVATADGIIICTPEYILSIPSCLKNAIEWCVSTTVLYNKPIGLITASANGEKGHEELKIIMETIKAKFVEQTTLLIQGINNKISKEGTLFDKKTETELKNFVESFVMLLKNSYTNYCS